MAIKSVQAIVNGVSVNLTYNNNTQKYEGTLTAPSKSSHSQSGGYYPVIIKATDVAGNVTTKDANDSTLGNLLRLVVKEKVAPVIAISSPSDSSLITNNKPVITWTVTDNDSGVNPDSIGITIDSGSKITGSGIVKTAITGGYRCTYTPGTALNDGGHTIKIDAKDNDGNTAVQKSVTFKIDTVPPVLSVASPVNALVTNAASVTLTGTTNDVTSSPVRVTVKLNDGTAQDIEVSANGSFSKMLSLVDGTNTIVITATDSAGKQTSITRTVTVDRKAPVINSVTITPNPVDAGKTLVIAVSVTD